MSLTATPPLAQAAPTQRAASQTSRGSYILVVDDEAVVRGFLTRCLEEAGYEVKLAGSAAEALELMWVEPAGLVLLDIRMPGENGLWLAQRLRDHWPQVPVVMATAVDDVQTMEKSRELGAAGFISKPIVPAQLLEIVRRVTAAATPAAPEASAAPEPVADDKSRSSETAIEAEYTLENPVRCSACGERVATLKAVRLIRSRVNFTSTLPRRGRVVVCPNCLAIVPAELTNF